MERGNKEADGGLKKIWSQERWKLQYMSFWNDSAEGEIGDAAEGGIVVLIMSLGRQERVGSRE